MQDVVSAITVHVHHCREVSEVARVIIVHLDDHALLQMHKGRVGLGHQRCSRGSRHSRGGSRCFGHCDVHIAHIEGGGVGAKAEKTNGWNTSQRHAYFCEAASVYIVNGSEPGEDDLYVTPLIAGNTPHSPVLMSVRGQTAEHSLPKTKILAMWSTIPILYYAGKRVFDGRKTEI